MRLFISINFDEDAKSRMLAVQRRLRQKGQGRGRFTSPDNLHLTLAFLGEQPEESVPVIKEIMSTIAVPQMTLRFSDVGCFRQGSGRRGSDRRGSELWWIGTESDPALISLQKDLVRKLRAAGFSVDGKKFVPHITLAREMDIGRLEAEEYGSRAAAAERRQADSTAEHEQAVSTAELLPEPFSAKADHISLMLSHRPGGKLTYTEL